MSNIQHVAAEKAIRAGYFNKNAFQRKEKLILVLKTGIAGLGYYVDRDFPEGKALFETLHPGTELQLFREADNKSDDWAIAVYTKANEKLGYIARFKNETIARLMDSGKQFLVFVDKPQAEMPEDEDWELTFTPTEDLNFPLVIYMVED